MLKQEKLQYQYLKQVYNHLQDSIVIMKENREILMLNPAAERLTGWQVGDIVPPCSCGLTKNTAMHEASCHLMTQNVSLTSRLKESLQSGKMIAVEMCTAIMCTDQTLGEREYLLVLRGQELVKQAEEVAVNKKMIRALIDAKESEHKRLAQELHDGVGQSLYTVSVALQAIESYVKDNQVLTDYISEVHTELQRVMDDVNAYSHKLRPHSLDQLGLEPTIRTMIEAIEKNTKGLSIVLRTEGLNRCDASVEINLYRVIQEALHNITKYANATCVTIDIKKDNTHIYMQIKDNGIGFNRAHLQGKGLGLKHMEERIDQLGGTCNIVSILNEGTTIDIVVPRWRPKI